MTKLLAMPIACSPSIGQDTVENHMGFRPTKLYIGQACRQFHNPFTPHASAKPLLFNGAMSVP